MTVAQAPDVVKAAQKEGWSGNDLLTILAIAYAESGLDLNASHTNTNGSVDRGLWQINSSHNEFGDWNTNGWQTLATNAHMARVVYGEQGFNAWSTYKDGTYKHFLGNAQSAEDNLQLVQTIGGGFTAAGTGVAAGLTDSVGGFIRLLESGSFWTRVGAVVIGGALLIGALTVVVRPAVTAAGKVATKIPIPV